jgi:putative nucleotidyltransferase with HDIG domain
MSTEPTRTAASGAPPTRALTVYVRALILVGGVIVAHSILETARTPHLTPWLILAVLAILTGSFKVNIVSIAATMSVADTFFVTSALLFGPGPATVTMAVNTFLVSWRRNDPPRRLAFNTFAPALSIWAGARAFFLLARVAPLAESHAQMGPLILPLLALSVIYFALNSGLTAVAVGLDTGQSPFQLWRRHFLWLSQGYLAAASVAFCLVLLIQQVGFAALIIVVPLVAVFHLTLRSSFGRLEDAHQHLAEMDRLYLSTVETLAMAIDAKDDVTHNHVRRVQAYAMGLARAIGVDDESTLKAIEAAALLHDTGKLAVPEHILNKPGGLTTAEFEKMKLHVDVGADILALVKFPYPVVPIVRCHHESWDGSGYPRGVTGEAIPIGARILSVVDCFDALTSDRPYRLRMTDEAALDILRERRGRMYDPRVVDTFIEIYRDIRVSKVDAAPEQRDVLQRISNSRRETAMPGDLATAQSVPCNLLGFVSLARVAGGGGTVSDVLALSSSLVAQIVPNATGAWYLPDGHDRLVVAEAFGQAAAALTGLTIGVGDRLTGWVAAHRQVIVNSDAALDLGPRAEKVVPALARCLSVPLMMGDVLVGVLSLYASAAEAFDEDRGRMIQMVAPHLACAIFGAARAAVSSSEVPLAEKRAAPSRDLRLVSAR